MKNMKISKKILCTFGGVIVLFIIAVGSCVLALRSANQRIEEFYTKPHQAISLGGELMTSLETSAKEMGFALVARNEGTSHENLATAYNEVAAMQQNLADLRKVYTGDTTSLDKLDALIDGTEDLRNQFEQSIKEERWGDATKILTTDYSDALSQATVLLQEIDSNAAAMAADFYTTSRADVQRTIYFSVAVSVFALILTMMMALALVRLLVTPIKEIENVATRMAEGDFSTQIDYESKDELGTLAEQVRKFVDTIQVIISDEGYMLGEMAKGNFAVDTRVPERYVGDFTAVLNSVTNIKSRLSNVMMQINQSADQVSAGSDQVSSGAQASMQQADAVVQVTQGMDQISSVVQTNSATAEQSAAASEELSSQASVLKELVGQFSFSEEGGNMLTDTQHAVFRNASFSQNDFYDDKY